MNLTVIYEAYIDCLNKRELTRLSDFVSEDVIYNGVQIGLKGYAEMLAGNNKESW